MAENNAIGHTNCERVRYLEHFIDPETPFAKPVEPKEGRDQGGQAKKGILRHDTRFDTTEGRCPAFCNRGRNR